MRNIILHLTFEQGLIMPSALYIILLMKMDLCSRGLIMYAGVTRHMVALLVCGLKKPTKNHYNILQL